MLTLSDKLLQLDDVVRGAKCGGHDEGEQQLLSPLHQVLHDPLDVTAGLLNMLFLKIAMGVPGLSMWPPGEIL